MWHFIPSISQPRRHLCRACHHFRRTVSRRKLSLELLPFSWSYALSSEILWWVFCCVTLLTLSNYPTNNNNSSHLSRHPQAIFIMERDFNFSHQCINNPSIFIIIHALRLHFILLSLQCKCNYYLKMNECEKVSFYSLPGQKRTDMRAIKSFIWFGMDEMIGRQ